MSDPESTYRVFLTRHYIAVEWYDVKATTAARARGKAKRAANKLLPDARAEASDNGWIADKGVILTELGSFSGGTHPMREVDKGVFKNE